MPPYGPSPADRLTQPIPNDEVPRPGAAVESMEDSGSPLVPPEPQRIPADVVTAPPPRIPTEVVTAPPPAGVGTIVSLIQSLVQEGVLAQDRANVLIRQARDEAAIAARTPRGEEFASLAVVNPPPPVAQPGAMPPAPSGDGVPPPQASANQGPPTIRVPYIPQFVRNQLKAEIEQELAQKALVSNTTAPNAAPGWLDRFHFYGDFRTRYEWDLFDPGNSPFVVNYAALNGGAPFDLQNSAGVLPPLINTTDDRERARIRLRLGLDVDITDRFRAGIRLASGNTTNPVTTNQNLGTTLNKNNFLIDRAYLEFHPTNSTSLFAGRFPSPWFSTTELVWDEDINFDGAAGRFSTNLSRDFRVFSAAGAFPIETSAFNFPDNSVEKEKSRDKWMYAGQFGLDWQASRDFLVRFGAAYYHFDKLEGVISSPCTAAIAAAPCDTDNSRPGFQQQGNTMFAIRNLLPVDPSKPPDQQPLFQYFGLASRFREVNLNARVDTTLYSPIHLIFDGDFVINLGFDKDRIAALNPVNNRGPISASDPLGAYEGGNIGFQGRVTLGYPVLMNRWDWNVFAAYNYIESDATVDAFNDSDFHFGGTNAKGYILGASLGVASGVNLAARWLSASEVSGLPYTIDVVLVDVNAKF
jgi:hypothetical protein